MAISDSFIALLGRIQPLQTEIDAIRLHIDQIKVRLRNVFQTSDFWLTGSFPRGTSIRGFSDADLFANFRKTSFSWGGGLISSDRVLLQVRQQLLGRYPGTPIRKDRMAIVATFSDRRSIDVVPAFFVRMYEKRPVFEIPDGDGGWMETCPDLYSDYIEQENRKSGGKLVYVAQLLKFWRECRTPRIPLSSFHIELLLATEQLCQVGKSYAESVRDVLRSLAHRQCAAMQDPFDIGGRIPAVKTDAQRLTTLNAIIASRDRANAATVAEDWNKTLEACRLWKIIFNQKFPS